MKIRTLGKIDVALILIIVVISSIIAGAVYFLDRVEGADDEVRRRAAEELEIRRKKEASDKQTKIDELELGAEPKRVSQVDNKGVDGGRNVIEIESKGDDVARMNDLAFMAERLNEYRELKGFYPKTAEDNLFDIDIGSSPCVELIAVGIITNCPKDPIAPEQAYRYGSDGDVYKLTALLDNQENGECDVVGDICIYSVRSEL